MLCFLPSGTPRWSIFHHILCGSQCYHGTFLWLGFLSCARLLCGDSRINAYATRRRSSFRSCGYTCCLLDVSQTIPAVSALYSVKWDLFQNDLSPKESTGKPSYFCVIVYSKVLQKGTNVGGPGTEVQKCLALLMFGLILAATSVMNISMAFFLAAVWVPVVVTVSPTQYRSVMSSHLSL